MLHLLHVTSWLSRAGGGIPPVVWALARETQQQGLGAAVVGLEDEWTGIDCGADGVPFAAAAVAGPKAFSFAPEMGRLLEARLGSPGVIHSHGLWMYPGLAARQIARKHGVPLVVSPHGMLEPWALNNARWKKKLAAVLFENRNLAQARCLHALCQAEAQNFRRYGLTNPIAVIPNGVDLEEFEDDPAESVLCRFPIIHDRRHLLFLSRIHPKKGLDNLLAAWGKVAAEFKDWQLLIAGSGDAAYENELKRRADGLVQKGTVVFLGPLYGREKWGAFALADGFVLPSFSEGFSVAILEAASAGVPVLLTPECNFPELARGGAALEMAADAAAIEAGLRRFLELDDGPRKDMGRRGRQLVEKSYTWPVIARQMCRVYEWLAGHGPMPETVQCV